jgi:putative transposase
MLQTPSGRAVESRLGDRFPVHETADYRRLKLANIVIVDEFTREALAMEVTRSIGANGLIAVLDRLVSRRDAPRYLRMDNGTETLSIEPGSPWENAFIESFNGRSRDEPLKLEEFGNLIEASHCRGPAYRAQDLPPHSARSAG